MTDELREKMRQTVAVGITMLYDAYKEDVLKTFSLEQLNEVVRITENLGSRRVEDIYHEMWALLEVA